MIEVEIVEGIDWLILGQIERCLIPFVKDYNLGGFLVFFFVVVVGLLLLGFVGRQLKGQGCWFFAAWRLL